MLLPKFFWKSPLVPVITQKAELNEEASPETDFRTCPLSHWLLPWKPPYSFLIFLPELHVHSHKNFLPNAKDSIVWGLTNMGSSGWMYPEGSLSA